MQETPGMQLRNKYTKDLAVMQNNNDSEYLDRLITMGVQVHQSLFPAFFQLRNGLKYPGMATKELIGEGETLVRVPEKLVLSSMKALQQPALRQVYEQPFYKDSDCWQDRILITYCLYIYSQHDKTSILYTMINHMSKQIDILPFWSDTQLDLFKDKTVKSAALLDRQQFHDQWAQFEKIQKKYAILQLAEFSKCNYQWMIIHIISRCFGRGMDYTSFVPYCQFFNHHSSAVYYEIDKVKENNQQQQQENDELSSDGSNQSGEYFQQGQFAYDLLQRVIYKWSDKQCLNLDKKEKKKIGLIVQELLEKIEIDVDWTDFSILFAGHFIERAHLMQSQYEQGRKTYTQTIKNLEEMKQILEKYVILIKAFYTQNKGKQYQYKVKTRDNLKTTEIQTFIRPPIENYHTSYSNFYLKTDKKDEFNPNTQVFFCYGRNSNRTLLLHYGFAIQGNKYQHVWLSYQLSDNLKFMPDLVSRVQKLGISIRRKYKVNYSRLNLDLIVFFRLNSWQLFGLQSVDQIFFVVNINKELLILQQIKRSLQMYLVIYNQSKQSDLTNKQINYHRYFINVYHLEKKRILLRQISLFEKLMAILKDLNIGKKMEEATIGLTFAQKYMFKSYLNSVVL